MSAPTRGLRYNEGKVRMDLIPPEWLTSLGEVMTKGAEKYAERNWEAGMSWGHCYAAALRHLAAFWRGEDTDPETGLSHLAHAAWNCLALEYYQMHGLGTDTRAKAGSLASQDHVLLDKSDRIPAPERILPLAETLPIRACGDRLAHGPHTHGSGPKGLLYCRGHHFDRT